jgi:hypothetical protein
MNSWASLAPKPADLTPKMGAFHEARRDAMKTESDSLDLQKKKILPQLFAGAVVAEPDGKGGIVHRFDEDRFRAGIAHAGPAAQEAYASYVKDVFPQSGTEAVGRATAAAITPEGGVNLAGMGRAAKDAGPYAPAVLGAARQQAAQAASTGSEVAGNLAGLEALGTDRAAGKTLQGLQEAEPSMLGGMGGRKLADLRPEDIKDTARAAEGLRSLGYAHDGTPAGLADAIRKAEDIEYRSQLADALSGKPEELSARIAAVRGKEDAIRAGVRAKILSTGLQVGGEKLSQKGAKQSQESKALDLKSQKIRMATVDDFQKWNFKGVDSSNLDDAQKLVGDVDIIKGAGRQADAMLKDKKELSAMSDDNFSREVFNALNNIKVAEGVSTLTGDENISNLFREQKSLGRIVAASSGPFDAFKNVIRNEVASSSREQVLNDIKLLAKSAATNGVARSKLRKYGADGVLPGEWGSAKPSKAPASGVKKAPPGPLNLDEL